MIIASSVCGQMHLVFSNRGSRKIIKANQVFQYLQFDRADLSRRPALHNGIEVRYVLVVVDIFSRYTFWGH